MDKKTKKYAKGVGFSGKQLSPDFEAAKKTWGPVVKTKEGQLEFIDALKAKETDAVAYLLSISTGALIKEFKKSITPVFRVDNGEWNDQFDEFINEAFLLLLSDKSPVIPFKSTAVSSNVGLMKAIVYWCAKYLGKMAGHIRDANVTGGVTHRGSKKVDVSRVNFDDLDGGDDLDQGHVFNSNRSAFLREDPKYDEGDSRLWDDWKHFCKSPELEGKVTVPSNAVLPPWKMLKDYLLGEKLFSDEYLDKVGLHPATVDSMKKKVFRLLATRFSREDLEELFARYGREAMAAELKPFVGSRP